MAYTANYQISRLLGEVARIARRAKIQAHTCKTTGSFEMKEIRRNMRVLRQLRIEIDNFNRESLGGIESQCIYAGMLASLRIQNSSATSLRDTDPTWASRNQMRDRWGYIRRAIEDHFCDLSSNDMFLSGDPYWIVFEARVWFEAWRNNLQVYLNT